jgi:hypothetical protein
MVRTPEDFDFGKVLVPSFFVRRVECALLLYFTGNPQRLQ